MDGWMEDPFFFSTSKWRPCCPNAEDDATGQQLPPPAPTWNEGTDGEAAEGDAPTTDQAAMYDYPRLTY